MLSIGEFSRITGLSVKALRFYHTKELLIPARVDAGSGYRFYDHSNIETAKIIIALRELEFSLDDIQAVLSDGNADSCSLLNYLKERRDKVEKGIRSQKNILSRLDQIISQEEKNQRTWNESTFEIEERELQPLLIGGIRMTGHYSDMGKAFGRLGRTLGRHISGPGMCLHYDEEYRDGDADFEPCFPVRRKVSAEGISVRELAGGRAVCLKHRGPYEELGRSYAMLFAHVRERGLTVTIPSREVYLKGPGMIFRGNPAGYVTEIQLLTAT